MEQTCHVIDLYDPLGALAFAFHHSGFHVIKSLDSVNEKELPILTRNNTAQLCPGEEIENLIETNRCKPDILTSQIYWTVSSGSEKPYPEKSNLDEIISAVQKFRPACLVFETRMRFKSSRAFENLLDLLCEDRYSVFWGLLNPREYAGIPLKEKRLYIIALSEALGKEFSFPAPIGIKRDPFDFLEPGKSYTHSERVRHSCTERGIYNWENGTFRLSDTVNNSFYRPVVNDGHGARYLTLREIARLKGFPDDYFPENSSNSELEQPLRQAANVHICRMIAGSIQKLLLSGAENFTEEPETLPKSSTPAKPRDTAAETADCTQITDITEETLERRYDVFVSSTYEDLKEERKEITQAILECDCIPVGMEMFPASNTEQWKFIQKVIDKADFYLVVIAGKYGSVMESTGKSYTEMEFDYAAQKGKPILVFQHKNINKLTRENTETDPQKADALEKFREKARQNRMIRFYTDKNELKAAVLSSLHSLKKQQNSGGWIRAEDAGKCVGKAEGTETVALKAEIDRLKQENNELRQEKDTFQQENDKVRQENTAVKKENDSLKHTNEALSSRVRETREILEQMKDTFAGLGEQVRQLLR
ncbi:DUF4062 domain-containing protein [Lachnoclostridium sp. An169]|uniref:DUF4062 domain-containing protein n=1 Tax=Lachnoclostridium sp. An169 TaxID=1965569 RepID=UPI0013A5FD07|nr:DUF4062 domain-containing protein [Lachnoclostridium sp. An169]